MRISAEEMVEKELDIETIKSIFLNSMLSLENVRDRMTQVVEYGVRRNHFRNPEPGGGYSIVASTDDADLSHYLTLHAHGGGTLDPRAGLRFASLETADNAEPDPAIVSYPVFKSALTSLVSAWDVRIARAYSRRLKELWNTPHARFLDLAWMTYLSPELAQNVTPPGDVLVEHVDNGGLLMIAALETFDTAKAKHMAAARSITNALEGVNTDEERRWQLLWPTREHRHH